MIISTHIIKFLLIISIFFLINGNLRSEYQWQIIPFNSLSTLTDVHFFDEKNGIIVGDSGTYLVTSNGGSNWLELPKLTKKNLTSIKFIDSKFGIITSFDTIFITRDEAKTWQKKGFGLGINFYQVGFSNKNNIWVVGDLGYLLYSSDGGKDWNISNVSSGYDIFNIFVINKNKILVSGSDGFIARIINNGELLEYLDIGFDSYITSMYFINEKTGFVSIDSLKILKTTDGGDSWLEVHKSDPDDWVMSFDFPDDTEGWAVTDMGLILKTTDAGNNWHEVLNTGRPLNSCFLFNKFLGFATGFMGTIYKYSDLINSAENESLSNLKFNSVEYDESNIIIKNLEFGDKIQIYNSIGELLFKTNAITTELYIPILSLTKGLYFIVINNKVTKYFKF